MLKRMFMESHHKNAVMQERMERVMKTLYTMFVGGGGNAPGLALTNKAPVCYVHLALRVYNAFVYMLYGAGLRVNCYFCHYIIH